MQGMKLLDTEKGKEMDSPLMPLEKARTCWHLDFSPVKLILHF